ncbi:unnamed protein product [Soboliphyme baturini]|uniref:Uncharacterized protein n=1 Tax=Soboliphyme baturini TaxID=241478 RepID=A0A183J0N2_9BILA|nr:unnamed protein product [Soboliphyme baturini]
MLEFPSPSPAHALKWWRANGHRSLAGLMLTICPLLFIPPLLPHSLFLAPKRYGRGERREEGRACHLSSPRLASPLLPMPLLSHGFITRRRSAVSPSVMCQSESLARLPIGESWH